MKKKHSITESKRCKMSKWLLVALMIELGEENTMAMTHYIDSAGIHVLWFGYWGDSAHIEFILTELQHRGGC